MFDSQIQEILEEFDFKTVHTVTIALNWCVHPNMDRVRTIGELKICAERVLRDVVSIANRDDSLTYFVQSGGFRAAICKNYIDLGFVVESWASSLNDIEYSSELSKVINYEPISALDVEL